MPPATRRAEQRFHGTAGRVIKALEGQNAQVVGSKGLTKLRGMDESVTVLFAYYDMNVR